MSDGPTSEIGSLNDLLKSWPADSLKGLTREELLSTLQAKLGAVARLLGDALGKPLVAASVRIPPFRIPTLALLEPVGL